MKTLPLRAVLTAALLLLGAPLAAAEELETAPAISAADVRGADGLKGPGYTVRPEVDPRGFLNHYEVESSFGLYEAASDRMLEVRLREIQTMERLREMGTTNAFMGALTKRLAALPDSLVQVVRDPVQAVKNVPEVVEKTFGRVGGFLRGLGKGEESTTPSPEEVRDALIAGQKRRLAIELKVDVYSSNPKLQELLTEVATARYAGEMTVSLASYAIPAGAATAIYSTASYNADILLILADKTETELREHNQRTLASLGVHEFVAKKFLEAPHLSPRHQTLITTAMTALKGVAGLDAIPQAAMEATDEARALLQEEQANALAAYHKQKEPLARLQADGGIVVAQTRSGRGIVLAPLDTVWLDAASARVLDALTYVPLMRTAKTRDLEVKGRVTPRFEEAAKARGFRVVRGWAWMQEDAR